MKSSTDIWFCAFLMINGVPIAKYEVIGRGRVKCYFELSDEDWQSYKLKFNNGELIKFKTAVEAIKDLSFLLLAVNIIC